MDSEDEGNDLYDTQLDKIDDVLYVQQQLNTLQASNQSHFDGIIGLLSQQEQQGLQHFF